MAHNLTINKEGVADMFSVRQVPWHGLGHIVDEAPNAAAAIKLAGLDWQVKSKQVFHHVENMGSNGGFKRSEGYQALVREDNNQTLSIMKDSYHPLQNKDAFNFFNPFIDSGLASFETAGSLKDGRIVWILAALNKAPIDIGSGDIVHKHLLLSNSHDGSMAVRVGFTPVRVVCNNTLSMSHGHQDSKLLRVRHTATVNQRLDDIQGIINAVDAKFEATAEKYKALSKTTINKKDLEKYIDIIFELRPEGTEREKSRAIKMRETITRLFENGAGQHLKSARGNYWGAYNAVTEYLTHEYTKDSDSRLYQNWFGNMSRKNDEALELALEAV